MRIVPAFITEDHQVFRAFDDTQPVSLDATEGLERRTGGPATLRAMAIERVAKTVFHFISDAAAEAST
jgi:hypothetical protein